MNSSDESKVGVVLRVGGTKRSCPSRSIFAKDWRGASLVQDDSFVN